MKPADWDVLGMYVRHRADELGLRDWFLLLKHDPPADEAALASCTPFEGRKYATVRVCTEFRELTGDEQREVILSGMLGGSGSGILAAIYLALEYAVDGIASAIAERYPLIAWTTPDPTREQSVSAPYEGPVDVGSPA